MPAAARQDGGACPSCGAACDGPWCAACGERMPRAGDLDLRHFLLKELPSELFDFDGKLPRTLRQLLTRPGALAVDFVAGRRRPYISPLRLYVVAFVFNAFLAFLFGGHAESLLDRVRSIDATGLLWQWASSRSQVHWDSPELRATLTARGHWLAEVGTLMIFLLVAAAQQLVFRRLHRRYLEHVTLALTVASFYILLIATGRVLIGLAARARFEEYDGLWQSVISLSALPLYWFLAMLIATGRVLIGLAARARFEEYDGLWQSVISLSALPLYWFLAIRRFYGLSNRQSALGALLVTVGNAILAILLNYAVFALLIATA